MKSYKLSFQIPVSADHEIKGEITVKAGDVAEARNNAAGLLKAKYGLPVEPKNITWNKDDKAKSYGITNPKITLNDLAEAIRYIDGVDFDNDTKEKYLEVSSSDAAATISEALIQLRPAGGAIGQITGPFLSPKPGKPTRQVLHVNIGMIVLMTKG